MKPGIGLYRSMLDEEHFAFARQAGATDVVVHLVDYHAGRSPEQRTQPIGDDTGWGPAGNTAGLWEVTPLKRLRERIEAHGLRLAAVENLDPADWHHILLDGPRREEQVEGVKRIVRNLGEAGVPVLGYNFSLAGVAGRTTGPYARGGAWSVGMEGPVDTPLPPGLVWNMQVPMEDDLPRGDAVSHDQLWDRLRRFLDDVLPVAEAAGVTLAAHPDDPPTPTLRGTPRLVNQPRLYQRLIDLHPSPANALELCVGTLAEMTDDGLYACIDRYARLGRIAYVHLRNVRGRAPHYRETFIDDGEVDARRVLSILRSHGFAGTIIPDHAPSMSCAAPWHAGMAHALGYIKGVLDTLAPVEDPAAPADTGPASTRRPAP